MTTNNGNAISAIDFLKGMFAHTNKQIYTCSFPNERDDESQVSERHVISRTPSHIESFASKWDRDGRGTFFCVATIDGSKRNKDNTRETIILHADIDFKNVDMLGDDPLKEVLKQLARLKYQPSATVFSGNGVHAYWLLTEPLDTREHMEAIELVLRQLADLVAGDLSVCEVSRVMRLPGTHNTKNGEKKLVEIIAFNPERRYELDDIEEWLSETSPIMLRKVRPAAVAAGDGEDGPESYFERYGREHGIKAPIDIEARLNAMTYMGGGDSSIHQTQLVVTASLLNAGTPRDEVIAFVLDATKRAASDYGARWNWRREERGIAKMCDDWIKKHPPEKKAPREVKKADVEQADEPKNSPAPAPTTQSTKSPGKSNVIPLVPKVVTSNKKSEQHITVGQAVLSQIRDSGEQLIRTPEGVWFFSGGIWELMNEMGWLEIRVEAACVDFGFISNSKLVNETYKWIMRRPELWRKDELPWDQHGKVPVKNGLVDPLTGELEPARPEHFCTWRIDVDYDPAAKCPWWEMMIADVFGDKDVIEQRALVRVIQEVLGAALVDRKPRQLSKALILWGISNQGKSGLIEVFTGLFGNNPIGVSIGSVETPHGLMPFTQRLPWVLHEAFGGQWHFSSTIKAIITQEPVLINIKNGPMLTQVVRAPIFWATNFQPQFKEATRAIINRMIVIECSRVFEDANPIGIAIEAKKRKLAKPSDVVIGSELPGVLNWALAGLRRALERGTIELTDSINETAEAIRRDSNLVAGFLDDCVEYDPMARVKVTDFCLAHSLWWLELKGEDKRLPTNESIGRHLKAIGDGRIGMDPKEMRDNTSRYYCGVAFNRRGLRYHKAAFDSRTFEGKIATATPPDRDVNCTIPPSWDSRKSVIVMRDRHAKMPAKFVQPDDGEDPGDRRF